MSMEEIPINIILVLKRRVGNLKTLPFHNQSEWPGIEGRQCPEWNGLLIFYATGKERMEVRRA